MKITPITVELLDYMGNDLTVVNTARVSFSKESEFVNLSSDNEEPVMGLSDADEKLVKYLANHNHWTPFGHCFAQFRIKAPVFVARQMVKHQIGLVWNEESRRYIDSEPEFYIPNVWRSRPSGSIKQGSGTNLDGSKYVTSKVFDRTEQALECYQDLLDLGVAPEQARMVLPLNTHTEWIWSGSLAAWARVCKLRLDPHVQKETADVAKRIDEHMLDLFPVSWAALLS